MSGMACFPLHPLRLGSASVLRSYNRLGNRPPKECRERPLIDLWTVGGLMERLVVPVFEAHEPRD